MLKIAVCDDEKYYREQIHTQLLLYLKTCGLDASVDLFSSGAVSYTHLTLPTTHQV